jgi:hypothetical protein
VTAVAPGTDRVLHRAIMSKQAWIADETEHLFIGCSLPAALLIMQQRLAA